METASDNEQATLVALVAFHEGAISGAQLRRAVRLWLESAEYDSPLEVLIADRVLDEPTMRRLEDHLDSYTLTRKSFASFATQSLATAPEQEFDKKAESSSNTVQKEEAVLAKSSSRSKSRSGKPSSSGKHRTREPLASDYYDSIHERFTRDQRLIPRIVGFFANLKRSTRAGFLRTVRSVKDLFEFLREWLTRNYRGVLGTTLGLAILIPTVIFLSGVISPNKEKKQLANQVVMATEGSDLMNADRSDGSSGKAGESLPYSSVDGQLSLPDASSAVALDDSTTSVGANLIAESTADNEGAAQVTLRAPENNGPAAASTESETAEPEFASQVPTNVVTASLTDSSATRSPINRAPAVSAGPSAVITSAMKLVESSQYTRAGMIALSGHEEFPESRDLTLILVVCQLANRDHAGAARTLTEPDFVDSDDKVWVALFTAWLLYAPPEARSIALERLSSVVSSKPESHLDHRKVAWIQARNAQAAEALLVLKSSPMFGERDFADHLFYSVALLYAKQPTAAREQYELARGLTKSFYASALQAVSVGSPEEIAVRSSSATITKAMIRYIASLPEKR